jgi:mono/diheme cytochrome c family protein
MGRPAKIALVVAALLLGTVVVLVAATLRGGFSTHDEPSAAEAFLARRMRSWATPADLRDATNPLPLTDALLADGRAHWADHCASCHGNDGKGKTALGQRLYPRAPDMTLPATQELSDGELFSIIENGIRLTGMPGWGDGTAASAHGSWGLVHFVRHLPELTAEELVGMAALNPKSPAEWRALQTEAAALAGESTAATPPAHEAAGHAH